MRKCMRAYLSALYIASHHHAGYGENEIGNLKLGHIFRMQNMFAARGRAPLLGHLMTDGLRKPFSASREAISIESRV